MSYYPKKDFILLGFEKSKIKNKKYTAFLRNKKTNRINKIHFGAIKEDGIPYEQYYDKLKLYSSYNHLDKDRRKRYIERHKKDINKPYSASYFSLFYLW